MESLHEVIFMRKSIPIKYLMLADILLSCGMAVWEFVRSDNLVSTLIVLLSVLFAASPLAYAASSPLVLFFAKKNAKKSGIEMAKAKALEILYFVDTLIVGKSGTITEGDPIITELIPENIMQPTLLSLAATAEQSSNHPIARIICQTAEDRALRIQRVSAFNEVPGCGVETILNGSPLRVGRAKWLEEEGIKISANILTKVDQLAYRGKIPVLVSEGKHAKGIIVIEDRVESSIPSIIRRLSKLGLSIIMFTGDSSRTASAIGKAAALSATRPNLTPEGKAREIQLMRTRGYTIAMSGPWDQDEPAFQEADLSIGLGKPPKEEIGSLASINLMDVTDSEEDPNDPAVIARKAAEAEQERKEKIEQAIHKFHLVLPDGLSQLLPAIAIARQAHGLIRQNRYIAYLAWILLLPPAMGLLAAFGGPLLSPVAAFLGMLTAVLLILLNSLRMRNK